MKWMKLKENTVVFAKMLNREQGLGNRENIEKWEGPRQFQHVRLHVRAHIKLI